MTRRRITNKLSSILIVILPTVAILVTVYLIAYKDLKLSEELMVTEIGEQGRILAEQTSIGIATFIRNIQLLLQHAVKDLNLAGLSLKDAPTIIDNIYLYLQGEVAAVAAFDSEGIGLAISPVKFADVVVGFNFSKRDYFQNVKATNKPYISSIFTTAAGNQRIAVAVPVLDADNVFRGLIASFLDVQVIWERFIEKIEFRRQGYGILTDGQGKILYHPGERYREKSISDLIVEMKAVDDKSVAKFFQQVARSNSGKVNFSIRGRPEGPPIKKIMAYSSIPLDATKWYLAIVSDYSEATKQLWKNFFYMFVLLIIVTGSLSAAATIFSKLESTKIKAVEQEKRTREWEETFNSMADLVYILDTECNVLRANRACAFRTGLSMEEIIGKKSYKVFFGSDAPLENCPCMKSVADGATHVAEAQNPATGETFLVTSSPIFDKQSRRVERLIVHAKDISERVRAERKLAEANRLLSEQKQLLEEQKEKLSKSMEELQSLQKHLINSEKLASLGRLTAGLAHEILNPLNTIGMIAQLLIMSGKLDQEISQDIAKIKEQVDRAAKITDSLAAFARQQKADKVGTDLNEIIEKALTLLEGEMTRENIIILKNYSQDLPLVMIDRDQMTQVILNLLSNARDAMTGGGQLTVATRFRSGRLEIVISDTGSGMDKRILDKIFDPFFTTKEVGRGIGLGLSVSYGIVENHGGTIRVESQPEKGATFIIELPG